jgi:hypothetical protein
MKKKVFCIGLGRTGTTTFGKCMRSLGFRHLGWEGGDDGLRADLGLLALVDYPAFIGYIDKFDSVDDYPVPKLYKKLAKTYPDARFVLTTRLSADKWVDSIISEFNRKPFNGGEDLWYEGALNATQRREILKNHYQAHLASVRAFFSGNANYLEVCWEAGHGWAELCGFLGEEEPDTSFPHANKSPVLAPEALLDKMLERRQYKKAYLYLKDKADPRLVGHVKRRLMQQIASKSALPNVSINGSESATG